MKYYLKLSVFNVILLLVCCGLSAQVWPGDASNNGEVNCFDLLYLGYAFGQQGAVRPNASTNWLAQTAAPSWGTSFPSTQLDISFADCDGNGIIDDQDILVIDQNYHLTNMPSPDPLILGNPGTDPTVVIKRTTTDTLVPGNLEVFEIHFGPSHISNFYGISFTISYDTSYIDSVVKVLPATGWITNNGQDQVIQVANDYLKPNAANGKNGRIDVSYSRTNGQTVLGYGIVGLFAVIMEDNVNGRYSGLPIDFEFEVLDIRMVNSTLNLLPTVPSVSEFVILTTHTNAVLNEEASSLVLYPNPASEYVNVFSEQLAINQLEIIDITGKTIQTKLLTNEHEFSVELYDLPKGIYVLKFTTQKGIMLKKLLISD